MDLYFVEPVYIFKFGCYVLFDLLMGALFFRGFLYSNLAGFSCYESPWLCMVMVRGLRKGSNLVRPRNYSDYVDVRTVELMSHEPYS